jgi:hypothetical protein
VSCGVDATSLTKPELVKKYMMGADVKSDWKVGSPLTYTGVTPSPAASLPREVSMAHANGHFVSHDLLTKDPKAAIAFYSEVVGWKTQPFTEGGKSDYAMWVGSQGPLGGVMKL